MKEQIEKQRVILMGQAANFTQQKMALEAQLEQTKTQLAQTVGALQLTEQLLKEADDNKTKEIKK